VCVNLFGFRLFRTLLIETCNRRNTVYVFILENLLCRKQVIP